MGSNKILVLIVIFLIVFTATMFTVEFASRSEPTSGELYEEYIWLPNDDPTGWYVEPNNFYGDGE